MYIKLRGAVVMKSKEYKVGINYSSFFRQKQEFLPIQKGKDKYSKFLIKSLRLIKFFDLYVL